MVLPPNLGKQESPARRRREQASRQRDSAEQQQQPSPVIEAPPGSAIGEPISADAGDVVALLLAQGVAKRAAQDLAAKHPPDAIRQQVEWHRYRSTVNTNPAGALVRAIRDEWAPPQAWLDAKEHEVAVARQAEEETAQRAEEEERRRRWETMTPEERVQGPLLLWTARPKLRGREPTRAEIAARQAELTARLASEESTDG